MDALDRADYVLTQLSIWLLAAALDNFLALPQIDLPFICRPFSLITFLMMRR